MFSEAGARVSVAVSIGLTDLTAVEPPADGEEMISRADQALYFSKESGRNRSSVWRPAGPLAFPRGGGGAGGGPPPPPPLEYSVIAGTANTSGAGGRYPSELCGRMRL